MKTWKRSSCLPKSYPQFCFYLLSVVVVAFSLLIADSQVAAAPKKVVDNATAEALQNLLNTTAAPRESTFSITYLPVFIIVVALIIVIGLYVYDVFADMKEEGGIYQWKNDTISLHCSDTTTNQFRFLLVASICFCVGLIWLLSWEFKARTLDTGGKVWWSLDIIAAICFAGIGFFPTHGDTTRHKIGHAVRDRVPEENGCMRCSTVVVYRSVVPHDRVVYFGHESCISRTFSKWVHLFTSLYAMIELCASNFAWSWWALPDSDDHIILFRTMSTFNLFFLCLLVGVQAAIKFCSSNPKVKAILYVCSMFAELCTLLLVVIVTMVAILHRDKKVLWIFSTCIGVKT